MFEHVIPYVPNGASENEENAYFLVGSLFGNYPEGTGRGNMGATFRKIRESSGSESVEGRFVALLKSPREDLPDHLRHGVALARSKSAPVNWAQLLYDIIRWEEAHGSVQREWARSYWEDRKEIDNEGIEEG